MMYLYFLFYYSLLYDRIEEAYPTYKGEVQPNSAYKEESENSWISNKTWFVSS